MKNKRAFDRQVEKARLRFEELSKQVEQVPGEHRPLLDASLEQLSVALEELHVAEEELRQENDELAASQLALAAERTRLAELFDTAPDGYLATDAAATILQANAAAAVLFGVRADRLSGKPVAVFVEEGSHKAFYAELEALRETGRPARLELRLKPRGRKPFPAEVSVAVARDAKGEPAGLRWLVRDVSERERAEEKLRESEGRFRQVVENVDQVVWVTDWEKKKLLYVNRAFEKVYGLSIQDAYANRHNWRDVIHPSDRDRIAALFADAANRGEYVEAEYRIRTGDGSEKWVIDRAYPIRDEHGIVYRFIGVAEDITGRKRAVMSLAESEARFRFIVESSKDFFFYVEDGPEHYAYVSPSVEAILGRPPEFFMEPHESMAYPGSSINETGEGWSRRLWEEGITPPPYIWESLHADGHKVTLEAWERPLLRDGKVVSAIGVCHDVTQRVELEERLRASEARSAAIVRALPDVLLQIDKDGVIMDYSSPNESLLYAPPESFLGRNMAGVLPASLAREAADKFRESLERNTVAKLEYELEMPGGRRSYEGRAVPMTEDSVLFVIHDITERRRAEEAIRASEEKFSKAFHSSPNLMAITTPEEGRIVEINDSYCQTLGYSREECIGRTTAELAIWANPKQRERVVRMVEGEGRALNVEAELRSKPGEIKSVVLSMEPITVGGKQYLLSVAMDVTERKRAEEELRMSEAKYRDLVETINDVIYATDERGVFTYVSPTVSALSNYDPIDIVGHNFLEFVHPEDRASVTERLHAVLGGNMEPSQYRIVMKDGQTRWIQTSSRPTKQGGRVTGLRGVMHDITERKQAEMALRKSEEGFRRIVETTVEGILATDADDRIEFVNRALTDLLGYSQEEMRGLTMEAFLVEGEIEDHHRVMAGRRSGFKGQYERRFRRKDGGEVWVFVAASPVMGPDGAFLGSFAMLTDITARKKADAAIKNQLEELRRWHEATLGREMRILDLKREVNELLAKNGEPPRYPSAQEGTEETLPPTKGNGSP